ncbi:hypothetical protein WJM97_08755 [Okeanomitos corallinicola TIOX110]|uniref:Spore coat protein U domain-containing protein n=1 Tax=Okeanomitos corallinicola TIOX110 TaxID=3133117 RepID=A0ABZ2UWI5_9CYAN
MIRRSLLTAALILGGSVIAAPKVNAQSIDVPFTGSVGGVCNVGQVTPGMLGTYSPGGPGTNPTMLDTYAPGGSQGKVAVSCNQDAVVSVSKPRQTGGSDFIAINSYSNLNSPFGSSWADGMGAFGTHIIPPGLGMELTIDMMVDKGVALVPDVYNFVTTVSITPL